MKQLAQFEHISDGPIWFFTADRVLNTKEQSHIRQVVELFFNTWDAHGHPVVAAMDILADQVVVIAADSTKGDVTGCSKDKLQHLFTQLGQTIQVDLFQRMLIPVLVNDEIQLVHWHDLQDFSDKQESPVAFIDTSIMKISDLRTKGWQPIADLLVV